MSRAIDLLLAESFTRLSRRFLKALADRTITHADFVVLVVVADKTVSWKQLWTELSNADVIEATGLSHQGVRNSVKRLVKADLLVRRPKGQSYEYALVPKGHSAAAMLAVDNPDQAPNSVEKYPPTQLRGKADPSFVFSKKQVRTGKGPVDGGRKGKADPACARCTGEGWVVTVAADGFTEAVAPCLCTEA